MQNFTFTRLSAIVLAMSMLALGLTPATTFAAESQTQWAERSTSGVGGVFRIAGDVHFSYGEGSYRRGLKGSGKVVNQARAVAAFHQLRVSSSVDVSVRTGAADALLVHGDDNLVDLVETVVEGDTLTVRVKPGSSFFSSHPVRVFVDARQLQGLVVNASGDVDIERITGDSFQAVLSGSGDVEMHDVDVTLFSAKLSGSGDLKVRGKAPKQSFELTGSGDVDADHLLGNTVSARLTGSGDLTLGRADQLDVTLTGSGGVSEFLCVRLIEPSLVL